MVTTAKGATMEPKKKGRPKGAKVYAATKVEKRLITMAKMLAAAEGVSAAEYLSGILDGPITRAYAALAAKTDHDAGLTESRG
ncbi:hypothetical protein [Paludisphaera soli]|uniref:hypothetical protein n=1 Tax=Paludisphaera soli TaxID=2712865 RepID=UPI0013EB5FFD|nr:hypothetical protein [Paludisphaera soli]